MKLASNSRLKRNLEKQVETYRRASDAREALKVILFFTDQEERKLRRVLTELGLTDDPDVVLIDARMDNKPSGSRA